MRRLLGTFDAGPPPPAELDAVVRRTLEEDRAFDDRSTRPLPAGGAPHRMRVVAREPGVIAGVLPFRRAFALVAGDDDAVRIEGLADGDRFAAGDVVLRGTGPAAAILSAERTALNFLQRLSGVATRTRRAVDAAGGRFAVCDTRKTTPGLRALEKWAVVLGGGTSHRWHLADMVMLKENHLALAGGVVAAVAAVRADPASAGLPITVEATTIEEAREAAALGVDRVLLDNMDADALRVACDALRRLPDRPELEASGGIRPEDLGRLADTGIDLVSLGALTHSAPSLDFSLRLEPAGGGA